MLGSVRMSDRFTAARNDVWKHAKKMWESGLVVGSAGNVSRRIDVEPSLIAVTPTSIPYDRLVEEEIAIVELATGSSIGSGPRPSGELPLHLEVYRARPEVQAIVHTHAPFVTTLSVLHKSLPPLIDEMMMYFGGTIEVTEYAFTGTTQIGRNVIAALGDRTGVILANHGNVCVGRTLDQALHVAITMESTARVYVQAMQTGTPIPLPEHAVAAGRKMFEEKYRL
jgi:L-fuculose-phosphate aldolase